MCIHITSGAREEWIFAMPVDSRVATGMSIVIVARVGLPLLYQSAFFNNAYIPENHTCIITNANCIISYWCYIV